MFGKLFKYDFKSNYKWYCITFAVLLCFRPRRRRAEGKELNSRTDIWEPAFRLAFRIARREKPP